VAWKPLGTVYVVNFRVDKVVVRRKWDERARRFYLYATVYGDVLDRVALGKDLGIELPGMVTLLDERGRRRKRSFSALLASMGLRKQDVDSLVRGAPFSKGEWKPVDGAEAAGNAAELVALVGERAKSRPEALASVSAWLSARLRGEVWTVAVEPLRNADSGKLTMAPRTLFRGKSAERAFDVAREMAGAFGRLVEELRTRYPDWKVDYTAYGERDPSGEDAVAARILLSRGEYSVRIWAPFHVRDRAFHISSSYGGVHTYPLAPVEIRLPSGDKVRVYALRVFHSKGWLENLLNKVDFLTRPEMVESSRVAAAKLSEVDAERFGEVVLRLADAGVIDRVEAEELARDVSSRRTTVLGALRRIGVSSPALQATLVAELLSETELASGLEDSAEKKVTAKV